MCERIAPRPAAVSPGFDLLSLTTRDRRAGTAEAGSRCRTARTAPSMLRHMQQTLSGLGGLNRRRDSAVARISRFQSPAIRRTHARGGSRFSTALARLIWRWSCQAQSICHHAMRRLPQAMRRDTKGSGLGGFTFVDAAWLRGTGFEFWAGADGTMPPTIEPKLGSDVGLVLLGGSLSWPMRFRGMPLARSAGLPGYEVRPVFFRFRSELRFLLP